LTQIFEYMNMYEVLNRTNCKRNAQRSVCGHGP